MGILIEKSSTTTRWDIPLMQGGLPPKYVNDWSDNSWLVEHLRQLADMIEMKNPRIMKIGFGTDCQYKIPSLYLDIYERTE